MKVIDDWHEDELKGQLKGKADTPAIGFAVTLSLETDASMAYVFIFLGLVSGVWKSFWCLGTYNLCLEICVNRDISSKCDIARKSPNLTKILKSA